MLFREQQMFYDELVGFKLPVPRHLTLQMPRDMINELRKALNRIREENNRMKIRLNQYRTQDWRVNGGRVVRARTIHAITSC